MGGAILVLRRRPGAAGGRAAAALLALSWLFVALVFHLQRYATINWAASYFAAGFALEAGLLLWLGLVRGRLARRPGGDAAARVGLGLFLFALALQPLIGPALGRSWTQLELFAVAPDPTAVATLGAILVLAEGGARWALLVLPLAWCAAGGATLWAMAAPDALVLPLAAAFAIAGAAWRGRSG
jgi:hypothetical protein